MSTMLKLVEQTKTCSACKKQLPLFSFSKNLAAKDGLQYKGSPCDIEYQKQRRENHKNTVLD